MAYTGTLEWLEETGGKLGRFDRLRLITQGIRAKASARRRVRSPVAVASRNLDDVLPPNTPLAKAAEGLLKEAAAPWLAHHSLRAWSWGMLLDDGVAPYDEEAVYVAFLLHDLGLTDEYRLQGDRVQCFTEPGARVAADLAKRHGWADRRAYLIANAISLHLNIIVGPEHGPEAQVVRLGAGADIIGQNLTRIRTDQRDAVLERHPRLDFKRQVDGVMCIEVAERPCCRMAFMYEKLGFGDMIASASFAE